jgi:N6-adenosine-specific RNA methylase IME4
MVPPLADTERRPFDVLVIDSPWCFEDSLSSSATRGAAANYSTMHDVDIARLPIAGVMAADSVCWSWVISSKLQAGLDAMRLWGFEHKQVAVWNKTGKTVDSGLDADAEMMEPDDLAFGMGHLHRNCMELILVGIKGSPYKKLRSRSVRNSFYAPPGHHAKSKHSAKPEQLQTMIETMFPSAHRLEVFARRHRPGWTCIGNEAPQTIGQDVHQSLRFLAAHVATPW